MYFSYSYKYDLITMTYTHNHTKYLFYSVKLLYLQSITYKTNGLTFLPSELLSGSRLAWLLPFPSPVVFLQQTGLKNQKVQIENNSNKRRIQ